MQKRESQKKEDSPDKEAATDAHINWDGEGCETYLLFPALLPVTFTFFEWSSYSDILSDILLTWASDSFWHIFWHSFWHSVWHSFWHSFWQIFCILSDILSDKASDISDILLTWASDYFWHIFWHSFWHSVWHSFWHSFWQIFCILSDILSDKASDSLSDILLSDTFRGWGPARNTGLTGSRLRSGAEHWTHRIAVEVRGSRLRSDAGHWTHRIAVKVRCGTLASQDRGWGPARNTDHTSSQDETEDETKEEKEKEKAEAEDKADIKSNNPHLTGGEIKYHVPFLNLTAKAPENRPAFPKGK